MRRLTIEDLERDLSLLHELRAEGCSQTALAERIGMSQGHLSRRLAAAKRYEQELQRATPPAEGHPGNDDLPWVELVDTARQATGPHYDLRTDGLVKPPGPFRIGDHHGRRLQVQHAGNGKPVEQPQKSKAKFKPKQPSKRKRA